MNSIRVTILSLAFSLGLSFEAFGQKPSTTEVSWENVCKDATAKPITPPRLSGPLKDAQLQKCDERDLYYGFGSQPNYPAALQCGWYQREHPEGGKNIANMFFGPGVLTMLYANGQGVLRSYDMAIRFACEQEWAAPAEMAGRIEHLLMLKDAKVTDAHFDLCDDITSGLSMGFCEGIGQSAKDGERSKKLAAITSKLTPAQKQLYDKLYAAENKFNETRVNNEVDLSGTARAMFALQDRGKLRDQFLINLDRFSKGDIPQATPADVKKLDEEMNALYQNIMQKRDSAFELGTVKREGIRETQRAWLPVRDAWIAFAKAAYPRLSTDRVVAQLIRLRLNQLRQLPVDLN